jgi:hypothetical protein
MVRCVTLDLRELFPVDTDERAVLSVVAGRTADDAWRLVHGALLIVPEVCAAVSWPAWEEREGRSLPRRFAPPLPATLVVAEDSWLLGRVAMTLAEAEAWLGGLLGDASDGTIVFPDVGDLPLLVARLERPAALLQVLPNIDSPTPALLAGSGGRRRRCCGERATMWTSRYRSRSRSASSGASCRHSTLRVSMSRRRKSPRLRELFEHPTATRAASARCCSASPAR